MENKENTQELGIRNEYGFKVTLYAKMAMPLTDQA